MKKTIKIAAVSFMALMTVLAAVPQAQAIEFFNRDKRSIEISPQDSGTLLRADRDMKKVLETLQSLNPKPIEKLTPQEARLQPTPADAVNRLLTNQDKDPFELKAKMGVTTKDMTFNNLPVRVYFPKEIKGGKPLPVIVYYHGGGFVIADINVYDATPRSLAQRAKAIVVAPEYRHAPEYKFPAAHQDAFAVYKWVVSRAVAWGGDPSLVALAGESAGGNLAANVAIQARDEGLAMPAHMLLVYPVAGSDMETESYNKNVNAVPLNKAMMGWFVKHAMTPKDVKDPRIDLVNADLHGLPAATVITASIDPLMSEGELLAKRLKEAGVKTTYKNYEGVTHEFFGMAAVVSDADDAQNLAVKEINRSFADAKKTAEK